MSKRSRRPTKRPEFDYSGVDQPPLSPLDTRVYSQELEYSIFIGRSYSYDNKMVSIVDLPTQTSSWRDSEDVVNKVFKVRTCVFDTESILWPANRNGTNLENWFGKICAAGDSLSDQFYDELFIYLDRAFENIDIDEIDWYNHSQDDMKKNATSVLAVVTEAVEEYTKNCPKNIQEEIKCTATNIGNWLPMLETLLTTKPKFICEKAYEEFFRYFLFVVGLNCRSGTFFSKLHFQYNDERTLGSSQPVAVSSEPDLFVYRRAGLMKQYAVGVVEVKKDMELVRMTSKSRGVPGTSSSSSEAELDKPSSSSEAELDKPCTKRHCSEEEHDLDCSLLKKNYPNGNPRLLTSAEKKSVQLFLPQLLGEIAAAVNTPQLYFQEVVHRDIAEEHGITKSALGFGVVGFKVYIVHFICVQRGVVLSKSMNFHDVPVVSGMGTDILISEPLSILKRSERNKLFRLLCAIKTLNYKDWAKK